MFDASTHSHTHTVYNICIYVIYTMHAMAYIIIYTYICNITHQLNILKDAFFQGVGSVLGGGASPSPSRSS